MEMPKHEELKRELMDKFSANQTYLGSAVKLTIQQTDFKVPLTSMQKPKFIKVGDVFTTDAHGVKVRPAVVLRVLKDRTVIYAPITSSTNLFCLVEFKSRFFGEGCFCKTISVCTEEFALTNFVGVFDNNTAIKTAKKELKEFINKNL